MSLDNDILKQFVLSQSAISNTSNLLYKEYQRVLSLVSEYLSRNDITTIAELRRLVRLFTNENFNFNEYNQEILEFSQLQSEQYKKVIEQYVTGITVAKLSKDKIEKVLKSIVINNDTIAGMQKTLTETTKTYFKNQMYNAYVNSATTKEINKELFARLPVINKKIKQHTITQTRTILNGISNGVAMATYQENSDINDGVQLLVTLDNRTSAICQHYGSTPDKVYDIKNAPKPPFHFNCRTILMPVIKDKYEKMFKSEDETRPAKFYDKDGNLKSVKQVSSSLSYGDWLRKQPKAFQKEVLGPTKYKLFNNGVKLNKFVDRNIPLSVAQLKVKYNDLL